jgi:sugar lactone lactonase YvrE
VNSRPKWMVALTLTLGLSLYLMLGLYTELKLSEMKPIPQWLLEDFGYYQRASADALSGKGPYAVRAIGTGFLYPPPALLFIELFGVVSPFLLRAAVFVTVNITFLTIMIYGIARRYGYSGRDMWYWFPLALGFAPFLETLHLGQVNVITQFGIFLMFFGETTLPILAGSGLAVAIITKVTPIFFLGYLFVNKRFRVIGSTVIAIAFLSGLALLRYGPGPYMVYPDVFQGLVQQFPQGTNSQSLVAKLAVANVEPFQNFLWQLPAALRTPVLGFISFASTNVDLVQRTLIIYVLLLLVLSGIATLLLKEREPLFIVASLGMMLSPNVMWYHHYVFALLPLLVWMAWSRLRPAVVLWCFTGLLLIQMDRWYLTYGLLIHVFGHASMLGIVTWQVRQAYGLVSSGKSTVSRRATWRLALGRWLARPLQVFQRDPGTASAQQNLSAETENGATDAAGSGLTDPPSGIRHPSPRIQVRFGGRIRVAEAAIVLYILLVLVLELQMIFRERVLVRLDAERMWQTGAKGSEIGQFNGAMGLTADASSNVYVADMGNRRIQKFDPDGKFVAQWSASGPGVEPLQQPSALALSADGKDIWLVDAGSGWVYRFSLTGDLLAALNGARYGLFSPRGIAVDANNNLYLTDTGNGRILKLDPAGRLQAQWGKRGTAAGEFMEPFGVAVDGDGIYVADTGNQRVQKLTLDGQPAGQWSVPGSVSYLATDGRGYLYVSDPDNGQVWVLTTGGQVVGRIGGQEGAKVIGSRPRGVAVDPENRLWVVGETQLARYRLTGRE